MNIININDNSNKLFYIGGVVRDELLGRDCFDVDITYVGNAIEYCSKFGDVICNNISDSVEEHAYMNSAYQNALQGFQEDVITSLERSSEDVKKYTRRLAAIQSKITK